MNKADANNLVIRYWQIIVVIITIAVGYGSMSANIAVMADELKEEKEKTEEARDDRQAVKLSIAKVEKDVEHIKENLNRQDQKLDKIIDKLNED